MWKALALNMLDNCRVRKPANFAMKILYSICVLAWMWMNPARAEQPLQSHESIYETVKDYIEQNISPMYEYEVSVVPIDNLLTLSACLEPLQAYTTSDLSKASGRVAVGVRCNSGNRWSIFVTAIVKFYQEVPVLTQPVHRGDIITRQHFTFEKREIARLGDAVAAQPEQLENKQATRFLPAGVVLSPRLVAEPILIRRGEKIAITSSRPGFEVRMNGQAMMDGARGQKIRVKNESSGRVISASVVESGIVSVDY
ncbi:flagellar basal body P-ring formation protein FlgA [Methylomicrobium sp. RS1]|nr:flagellar basal body P-ring formation protein FlgA [Methylomicrobium sp. RS1]